MSSQLSSRRDRQIVRILFLLDGISYFPHGKSEMLRGIWHFLRGKREMPHGFCVFPRGKSEILRRILDFLRRKGEIPIRLSNLEFSGSKVPFACLSQGHSPIGAKWINPHPPRCAAGLRWV